MLGDTTPVLEGASDNTLIGNTGDRLKVISTFSKEDVTTDVTGQLAVSQRTSLLNYYFSHTDHQLLLFRFTLGTGTVTWNTTQNCIDLSAGTASGALSVIRSKHNVPYQVGQSHTVAMSCLFGEPVANSAKGWGINDANDGLQWRMDDTSLAVVVRSSTSGSTVDTVVHRADWNIDKLDGTGPSGFNLNTNNVAVYLIEYTWHGAGRVRFGIKVNKDIIYCHEFDFDNSQQFTYTRLPMLPLVASVSNTGTLTTPNLFKIYTISAYTHNHLPVTPLLHFAASRGTSTVSVTGTATPLIGIRPRATFNSQPNRVTAVPEKLQVSAGNSTIIVRAVINPTVVTGAVWNSVNTSSSVEFDTAATVVTGGTVVNEFYVNSGTFYEGLVTTAKEDSQGLLGTLPLAYTTLGPQIDTLYLVAQSLGGSSSSVAAISWEEYQ